MKTRDIIRQLLLAFVLISIGFALGKEAARRSEEKPAPDTGTDQTQGDKIIAYYLYGTFRCVTCNKIEATAKEVVQTKFAKELKAGRLEWKTANFQEDEALAKRYNIAASTLVLVQRKNGKDIRFEKLEDVWTLVNNRPAFVSYVQGKIKSCLEGCKR